ncbi:MAG: hypothetical protein OER12_01995 [Acidimicrobiia bacterium]|nr:hypothetical protein [Acidimicrobiia bacterium]
MDTEAEDWTSHVTGDSAPETVRGGLPGISPDLRPLLGALLVFGIVHYLALTRLVRGDVFNSYPFITSDGRDWLVEGFAIARWFDGVAIPELPALRSPGFVGVTFVDYLFGANGHLLFGLTTLAVVGAFAAILLLARWRHTPRSQAAIVLVALVLSPLGFYRMFVLSDQVASALMVVAAVALYGYLGRGSRRWLAMAAVAAALGGVTQLYSLIPFLVVGGWSLAVSIRHRELDRPLATGLVAAPLASLLMVAAWLALVDHTDVPTQLGLLRLDFNMLDFYTDAWSFTFLPLVPLLVVLFKYRKREVLDSPVLTGYWLSVAVLMVATFFYQFEDLRFTIPTGLMLGVAIMATLPGERPLPRIRGVMVGTVVLAIGIGLMLAPARYPVPEWSDISFRPGDTFMAQLLKAEPVDRFSLGIHCDSDRLCAGVPLPAVRTRYDGDLFAMYRFLDTADSSTLAESYEGMFEGRLLLRNSNDCCTPDLSLSMGEQGDRPVVGHWKERRAGSDPSPASIGFFQSGRWLLPPSTAAFEFGQVGDVPLMGDWDGDGVDTVGVFRDGLWLLRNANGPGPADHDFLFGEAADEPVVGDWDGDGVDTVGVFRDGRWMLTDTNGVSPPEYAFDFGSVRDQPVAGDWDGDGVDTVGFFIDSFFALRSTSGGRAPPLEFYYGAFGDIPLVGDWDGDGIDTIGVAR